MKAYDTAMLETLLVFTALEEGASRRAYRAGRGARYCGDPGRCGSGFAPGAIPPFNDLYPQIAVN